MSSVLQSISTYPASRHSHNRFHTSLSTETHCLLIIKTYVLPRFSLDAKALEWVLGVLVDHGVSLLSLPPFLVALLGVGDRPLLLLRDVMGGLDGQSELSLQFLDRISLHAARLPHFHLPQRPLSTHLLDVVSKCFANDRDGPVQGVWTVDCDLEVVVEHLEEDLLAQLGWQAQKWWIWRWVADAPDPWAL